MRVYIKGHQATDMLGMRGENLMPWFWRSMIAVLVGIISMAGIAVVVIFVDRQNVFFKYIPIKQYMPSIFGMYLHWWMIYIFGGYVIPQIIGLCIYSLLTRRYYMIGETRCRKCGHILRGITKPRCSECGERI